MARKKYDVMVKVGEYQKDGQTKSEYKKAGVMMVNDDGSEYLIMDRTFNPAGVPNPDNKATVILSLFSDQNKGGQNGGSDYPRQQQAAPARQQAAPASSHRAPPAAAPQQGFDDDIPF